MGTLKHTLFFIFLFTQICFAQWFEQNSGTTQNLNTVSFIDDNNGFAVGDSGIIRHTTNAGANWGQQASGTIIQLNDVLFINESTGWIVGGPWPGCGNVLLHTTDAGINWIQQTIDTSLSLNSIFFLNENIGWIAGAIDTGSDGSTPVIIKTLDGGFYWQINSIITSFLQYGYGSKLSDVYFVNGDVGYAVAGGGNIGDAYGCILKTTDGGENWIEQIALSADYESIAFLDEQNGIAVGRSGYGLIPTIVRTTDGGINWANAFQQDVEGSFNSVAIVISNYAWAVGQSYFLGSTICFSSDKGVNWTNQIDSSLYLNSLNSVFFIDSTTGWVVGSGGTILNTTNGGVSFVEEEEIDEMPTEFLLSQNYPNPFNPSTKIKYSVPQTSQVQIKVFDVLGNEIETLVNEEKPAGTSE